MSVIDEKWRQGTGMPTFNKLIITEEGMIYYQGWLWIFIPTRYYINTANELILAP